MDTTAATVEYRDSVEGLGTDALRGFFEGWPNAPSTATHLALLRAASHVEIAIIGEDRVVGFVYAISDHILSAYIPLLEVLPSYRGRGIASELMRRLLARLDGLYMVDTTCDSELVPFYERFGLIRGSAVVRRNYAAQRGMRPPHGAALNTDG